MSHRGGGGGGLGQCARWSFQTYARTWVCCWEEGVRIDRGETHFCGPVVAPLTGGCCCPLASLPRRQSAMLHIPVRGRGRATGRVLRDLMLSPFGGLLGVSAPAFRSAGFKLPAHPTRAPAPHSSALPIPGCVGTADNRRRREGYCPPPPPLGPPPPPPLGPPPPSPPFGPRFHSGQTGNLQKEMFIWAFFGPQIFGIQTPPPPLAS